MSDATSTNAADRIPSKRARVVRPSKRLPVTVGRMKTYRWRSGVDISLGAALCLLDCLLDDLHTALTTISEVESSCFVIYSFDEIRRLYSGSGIQE